MKTRTITLLLQIASGEMPEKVRPSHIHELINLDLIDSVALDSESSRWFTTEKGEILVDKIKELATKEVES